MRITFGKSWEKLEGKELCFSDPSYAEELSTEFEKLKAQLSTLINQKEKEARIDELETFWKEDPHFFAVCGYHATGENKELDEMAIANYKLSSYWGHRIKQLKEELKGGKD